MMVVKLDLFNFNYALVTLSTHQDHDRALFELLFARYELIPE